MGRRPNPLILEFFERGAKLNDNSNRYHHRCKSCGEDFPKGRIDSLTTHLTKKCPAITEAERINACLALHGINNASGRPKYDGLLHSGPNLGPNLGPNAVTNHVMSLGQNLLNPHNPHNSHDLHHSHAPQQAQNLWAPLETLAEVSRRFEANEKHDDHITHDPTTEAVQTTLAAAIPTITVPGSNPFELQEQFTLENPPLSYNELPQLQQEKKDASPQRTSGFAHHEHHEQHEQLEQHEQQSQDSQQDQQSQQNQQQKNDNQNDQHGQDLQHPNHDQNDLDDQRIQQLLQSTGSPTQTALSVAAAATARLTSSLLDPQLITDAAIAEQIVQAAPSTEMVIDYPEPEREQVTSALPPLPPLPTPVSAAESSTPWGGMTYLADDIHAPASVTDHSLHLGPILNKGGYRMDTTTSPNGARHRHSRARFDSSRRREVQEVRRIGACIRCRILRKTCSKGTPCDTCKKVLSPRVWRTGCVRTKLSEFIDLYSAGVQVVMAQKRINGYKTTYHLENSGVVVEASHFPETGHVVSFHVFQGHPKEADENAMKLESPAPVVLLDNDKEDIPGKVEAYMRLMLPEYIAHEPSPYVRVTLEIADQIARETNDELLKRSLELWGIVEMMDRERQWTMLAKFPDPEVEDHWIKDDTESEAYSNVCMQLTAAAERKASVASRNLLNGIQRNLQDGKTKLGFPMFLTVMLFLNCLEKTTWAFKAWDEENLRPKWPLERPPSSYTNQGHALTELLRMLLVIRHVLPKTIQTDPDVPIVALEESDVIMTYFENLNVTPRYLQMRYDENNFQPTDSRSLEFLFCAQLLLNAPSPPAELNPIPQGALQANPQAVPQVASQDMSETNSQDIHQDA